MGNKSSVLSSSSWTVGVKFVERAVSLIIYIMLARFLSVKEFGIVAFSMLFLEFITVLISSGVKDFILTRKSLDSKLVDTCTFAVISVSIIVSAIFYFLMDIIFSDKSVLMQNVFTVLLLLPAISSFNVVQTALLQRGNEFKSLSLRNLASTMVAGIISVYCAYDGYGAWALVINQYCKVVIDTLILQFIVRYKPKFSFSLTYLKECYAFSLPLLMSEVMNFWSTRMMDLFVSMFHGASSLAILNISRKFTRLVQQLSLTSMRPVVLSYASKAENKSETFAKFIGNITSVVAPVLIAIGVFAKFYITTIFGEQWEPAVIIVEVLSFTALAQCLSWYFGLVLITNFKTALLFKLNVMFIVLFILSGSLSYKLSFLEYIAVQALVINCISIFKMFYLVRKDFIRFSDFKEYIVPSVFLCAFFILFSLSSRFLLNSSASIPEWGLTVLSVVFSLASFVLSILITMIIFNKFARDFKSAINKIATRRPKKSLN